MQISRTNTRTVLKHNTGRQCTTDDYRWSCLVLSNWWQTKQSETNMHILSTFEVYIFANSALPHVLFLYFVPNAQRSSVMEHNTGYKTPVQLGNNPCDSPTSHIAHECSSLAHTGGLWTNEALLVWGIRIGPCGWHCGWRGGRGGGSGDGLVWFSVLRFLLDPLSRVRRCSFGRQEPFLFPFLLLHPSVLEPDFHLSLVEL